MLFRKKEEEPIISFVSTVEGLEEIEECRPRPAGEFIPEWWDKVDLTDAAETTATIKACPGIIDHFSQGYVIPMWADTTLYFEQDTGTWRVHSGLFNDTFAWTAQTGNQALDYFDMTFFGNLATFIFRAHSPWNIITKKGWSVYQLPLFYHFENDFTVLPGVIDTDVYHFVTPQAAYFGDKEEIFIPRGKPFVQYIPFKRSESTYDVRFENKQDKKKFDVQAMNFHSLMTTPLHGAYRRLQQNRDKMV